MKKYLSVAVILLLILSFGACKGKKSEEKTLDSLCGMWQEIYCNPDSMNYDTTNLSMRAFMHDLTLNKVEIIFTEDSAGFNFRNDNAVLTLNWLRTDSLLTIKWLTVNENVTQTLGTSSFIIQHLGDTLTMRDEKAGLYCSFLREKTQPAPAAK